MIRPARRWWGARPARPATGQATVELALLLPLLVLFLMAAFQTGLVARDFVLTVHAAREAVREAAVGGGPERTHAVVAEVLPGAEVTVRRGAEVGDRVTARVRYVSRTQLPLVGPLFPDVSLHADAVMRRER